MTSSVCPPSLRIPRPTHPPLISNRIDSPDNLGPRVELFLTPGERAIKPYDAVALRGILNARAHEALYQGPRRPAQCPAGIAHGGV